MNLRLVLLTTLTPIITYLAILIIKEAIPYIRYLLFYKHQKIPYHYSPVLGWISFYTGKKQSNVQPFIDTFSIKYKNQPIIAVNELFSTRVNFMLNSPEVIKEFFIKETDFTRKKNTLNSETEISFFWRSGKKALEERAIFNKFFEPVNLKKISPAIRKVIDENLNQFKKNLIFDEKTKIAKEVDLMPLFEKIFSEIVDTILFGEEAKDTPKVDGDNISIAMEKLAQLTYHSSLQNPLVLLSFGFLTGKGFMPVEKEIKKQREKISKTIGDLIKNRIDLKKEEEYGVNLIDLMLKHNASCEEREKLSMLVMTATVMLFQLAGIDTSRNVTQSLINFLSLEKERKEKFVKKIVEGIKDKNGYEAYEENEILTGFVNEALRIYPPGVIIFPREVVKDVKIGDYKIKKGDKIMVPIYALQNSEMYFDNSGIFDEDRLTEGNMKKIKKNTFLPFSAGKRACVGKYLALLLVKMNVCAFFDHFEIVKGYETKHRTVFTYGVESCKVDLRVNNRS